MAKRKCSLDKWMGIALAMDFDRPKSKIAIPIPLAMGIPLLEPFP